MSRLALVTTDMSTIEFDDPDLEPIRSALVAAGHDVELANWHDEAVDWSSFDLAIIRCPWDYMDYADKFTAWLERVEAVTTVCNPPDLIRWNLNKEYLLVLEALGMPIVPTILGTTSEEVGAAIAAVKDSGFEDIVIKPTVSAGSKNTGLFAADDPAARELADTILSLGKVVMVQPAIPSVPVQGEQALMFFGGEFSHAFSKGPLLAHGGGLLGGEYEEQLETMTPSVEEFDLAHQILVAVRSAAPGLDGRPPLYARIDLVSTDEGPLLLEAEMFEPSYNVWLADGLVERFVAAVESVLG